MFLNSVQGEHGQMRRSEDFLEEKATRFMGEEQLGLDMDGSRIPCWTWKRKSLTSSAVSVTPWISLCRECFVSNSVL
jgi:hypothetical protein